MVDRFQVQSLSVERNIIPPFQKAISTICYWINKKISILHYDVNHLNVSEISRKLSWLPIPPSLLLFTYDVTKVSPERGCEPKSQSSKIYFPNI